MNWSCPNQIDGHCEKLDEPCHPVQEGCVLEGKVKVIGKEKKPAPPPEYRGERLAFGGPLGDVVIPASNL